MKHSTQINTEKGFSDGWRYTCYTSCVLCLIPNYGLSPVPQVRSGSSWCLTGCQDTRALEDDQRFLPWRVETYSCRALVQSSCTSRFHFIREIMYWRMDTETQYQILGTAVLAAQLHFVFSFRPPLFWLQISPFNCHHLWLRKSEMTVPLIQTHSYGLKPSVFFNSHTVLVDSCGFFVAFFSPLPSVNLQWSNGWRRQMSSWLSVTSDESWNRQTARWCLLSDTLEMNSHSIVPYVSICLRLL